MDKFLYNNRKSKELRKNLRKSQTDAESILWSQIRNNQLGYKFRRQYSCGPFILDFYCSFKRLGIELDGSQHKDNEYYDERRTLYLNSLNIKVVRFWNNEIFEDLDAVLEKILSKLE